MHDTHAPRMYVHGVHMLLHSVCTSICLSCHSGIILKQLNTSSHW